MRVLNRKLLRDLWYLRGQVLAIGAVIASGVAVLVMSLSTLEALRETSTAYYQRYQFAEVFASVKRAPEKLSKRVHNIAGVHTVETRIVHYATLDVEGFAEPVMGQLVSIPDDREPTLNKLALRAGRWITPARHDEVILHEAFASAHGLQPGDELQAVLNGHQRTLRITGIALSPEFIYNLGPGALLPDELRFGVIWMSRAALAAAFDLQGAFNEISLTLIPGVQAEQVIQALDGLLDDYGGNGAMARADQISNWFVMNEIKQQATMSVILPGIFLLIAAFLTNMVLARLISIERSQIGLLKAFGYRNSEVAAHYALLVSAIASVGIIIGFLVGVWLGRLNTQIYADLFRFPLLLYRPSMIAFALAGGLSLLTALAGAASAVRHAVTLTPAQAMLPPSPPIFQRSRWASNRVVRWIDQPTRIMLRDIARWPLRSGLTGSGIAAAVALLVMALQWEDSLDYLAQSYFFDAQHQDVSIGLADPQASNIVHDFTHMPGVLAAEPARLVSADLSAGPVTHRGAIYAISGSAQLQPAYDERQHRNFAMPASGLVLSTNLAEKLEVTVGEFIWVKLREGRRPLVQLPITGLLETYLGMPAYMHIDALHQLLHERRSTNHVSLLIDTHYTAQFYRELKSLPSVSAVMLRQAAIDAFYSKVVEHLMVFVSMFSILACALGFGIAYNSTRIALSERGRELATLRVLGFRSAEIAYILLGEIVLLSIIALPFGCLFGYGLVNVMTAAFKTELFRIPLVIEPSTYGGAMLITLLTIAVSAMIVLRRIKRLDLIKVLKTRE